MSTISASSTSAGLEGIRRGMAGAEAAARRVASAGALNGESPPTSMAEALVDMRAEVRAVEAAARVLQAEDRMRGALLDVFA